MSAKIGIGTAKSPDLLIDQSANEKMNPALLKNAQRVYSAWSAACQSASSERKDANRIIKSLEREGARLSGENARLRLIVAQYEAKNANGSTKT